MLRNTRFALLAAAALAACSLASAATATIIRTGVEPVGASPSALASSGNGPAVVLDGHLRTASHTGEIAWLAQAFDPANPIDLGIELIELPTQASLAWSSDGAGEFYDLSLAPVRRPSTRSN
jgi:hypothetical protein